MTLKEKLRQGLTGHLSDDKTEVDVNIAAKIAEDFAIGFASYLDGYWEVNTKRTKTIKELLEIYKQEI